MIEARFIHGSLAICLILLMEWISPASASIGIAGSILQEDVRPGQSIEHVITILLNKSDQPMDMTVEVGGFGDDLGGGHKLLKADQDNGPCSARPFLKISPDHIHLNPGTSQNIILEGTVPEDVGDGSRFALVNIRSLPVGKNKTVGIEVAFNVPVVLNIIDSKFIKTGEITDLNVSGSDISVIFKNTGNTNYMAKAIAILRDNDGAILSNTSSSLTFSSIIPTASRRFRLSLKPETKLKPGNYILDASVALTNGTILATRESQVEIRD